MDTYEKKYNEALKWMRELYPRLHGATKEDAEHYFPELRESEDERIRKWLYDYISNCPNNNFAFYGGVGKDAVLNYLEKQKEQHIPWYDYQKSKEAGYTIVPNEEYEQLIKQKEQKPAVSREEVLHQLFQNGSITLSDYQYLTGEQKPADYTAFEKWLDDWYQGSKEIGGCVMMSESEFKNWSRGIRNMYQQKPAEWREEDEKMRDNIICILQKYVTRTLPTRPNSCTSSGNAFYTHQTEIDWLKSLCPVKQEWSKKDEDKLYQVMETLLADKTVALRETPHCKALHEAYDEMLAWLKSIRPQPHWKPSEEHLSALLAIFNDPNNIGSQTCQLALTDLYEQLKKLGVKEDPEYYQHFDPDC